MIVFPVLVVGLFLMGWWVGVPALRWLLPGFFLLVLTMLALALTVGGATSGARVWS